MEHWRSPADYSSESSTSPRWESTMASLFPLESDIEAGIPDAFVKLEHATQQFVSELELSPWPRDVEAVLPRLAPDSATKWFLHDQGQWSILGNGPWADGHYSDTSSTPPHFHGCTLSQAHAIWNEGFNVGLGVHKGYHGFWGMSASISMTGRGHALERCTLSRGRLEGGWLTSWCCPVAICVFPTRDSIKRLHSIGWPPCRVQVVQAAVGDVIPTKGRIWFEIHFHKPTLYRFFNRPTLASLLGELRLGSMVLCGALLANPTVVLSGHNLAATCGEVVQVSDLQSSGWSCAQKSKIWRCPTCQAAKAASMPYTEIVLNSV